MTISEAARRLGYKSRSQLYRLINDGYLHEHVHVQLHTGQRLVDIEGLREKLHAFASGVPTASAFVKAPSAQGLKSRPRVCLVLPAFKPP